MLFEPTYVLPDLRNGLGNGVIDVNNPMTISWRLNGQPYLYAYQIQIMQNNTASTVVYDTGKVTRATTVPTTDEKGVPLTFYVYIPNPYSNGLRNGNEYKIVITQWWSASEFVIQNSASVFITRATPTLSLNVTENQVIGTRNYDFVGTYTQGQGDVLNWARWQIVNTMTGNTVYDSGELYGVSVLQTTYNGFVSGQSYSVQLTVQTQNGVEVTAGPIHFTVEYSTVQIPGDVVASNRCGAALVNWSNIVYINGTGSGITYNDGIATIASGGSADWNSENGLDMSLDTPFSIIYRGQIITAADGTTNLLTAYKQSETDATPKAFLQLRYLPSTKRVALYGATSGNTLTQILTVPYNIINDPWITVIITPTAFYFRAEYTTKGLFPSTTLYPSANLYPSLIGANVKQYQRTFSRTVQEMLREYNICALTIGGPSSADYLQIINGTPSQSIISDAYFSGTYAPTWTDETQFLANFNGNLLAGNITTEDITPTGYYLTRQRPDGTAIDVIGGIVPAHKSVWDYSVKYGQDYSWFISFVDANNQSVQTTPIQSNTLSVCFTDHLLLACRKYASGYDGVVYVVEQVYRFGKNFSSGSISNNNTPGVTPNLTRYPTVQQSASNYKSGTLTSLIGVIDSTTGAYSDTAAMRDALFSLPLQQGYTLFLKDKKGDLLEVAVSGAMDVTVMDGTVEQAQSITVPWVEVGDTDGVSLISFSQL